eukprot:tig00000821_g4523.t1
MRARVRQAGAGEHRVQPYRSAAKRLRVPHAIALGAAGAAIALLLLAAGGQALPDDIFTYGLVIDAGSSGSRISIYRFVPQHNGIFAELEEINPSETKLLREIEPGISSYAEEPPKAGASLAPLIEFARAFVPEQLHEKTSLFLGATAGMRLLTPDKQEAVLAEIRAWLADPSNSPFHFEHANARIISGEEEGVFGWMQVNFLLKNLGMGKEVTDAAKSVAVLDLGGASAQITFEPESEIMAGVFNLVFDELVHRLYTHSYLNFGADRAHARLLEALVASAKAGEARVQNPCYLKGYEEEASVGGRAVTFVGTGEAGACRERTAALLLKSSACLNEPCAAAGVYQPPLAPGVAIFGVSTYYYYAKGLGLTDKKGQWKGSARELAGITRAFCGQAWAEAKAKHEKEPAKRLKTVCFRGTYIEALLSDAFGAPAEEKVLTFAGAVGDSGMGTGWTLGMLLYELQLVRVAMAGDAHPPKASAGSCAGGDGELAASLPDYVVVLDRTTHYATLGIVAALALAVGWGAGSSGLCSAFQRSWAAFRVRASGPAGRRADLEAGPAPAPAPEREAGGPGGGGRQSRPSFHKAGDKVSDFGSGDELLYPSNGKTSTFV